MSVIVEGSVEELKQYERDAIWLQTYATSEWESEDESERSIDPVMNAEISEYNLENYFLAKANSWSNQAISDYSKWRFGWD